MSNYSSTFVWFNPNPYMSSQTNKSPPTEHQSLQRAAYMTALSFSTCTFCSTNSIFIPTSSPCTN